jgi:hypothetical protein
MLSSRPQVINRFCMIGMRSIEMLSSVLVETTLWLWL